MGNLVTPPPPPSLLKAKPLGGGGIIEGGFFRLQANQKSINRPFINQSIY